MKSLLLHRQCRWHETDVCCDTCNDQVLSASITDCLCKVGVVPGVDDALTLSSLLVSRRRRLLDHIEQKALNVGFPRNGLVSVGSIC